MKWPVTSFFHFFHFSVTLYFFFVSAFHTFFHTNQFLRKRILDCCFVNSNLTYYIIRLLTFQASCPNQSMKINMLLANLSQFANGDMGIEVCQDDTVSQILFSHEWTDEVLLKWLCCVTAVTREHSSKQNTWNQILYYRTYSSKPPIWLCVIKKPPTES